ncbi:MAG: Por secretion system protein [Bacteroidales bacterium]|nr:Por secretion system protein [Bacteroidales bacterium]
MLTIRYHRLVLILCLLAFFHILNGQVVTTDPPLPTGQDAVQVIFDANQGDRGLADYSGDVWAHTGVITDKSNSLSDWRYVIAPWNQNPDKTKLSPLGNDRWVLSVTPDIRTYYGVPDGEKILKMAFVFRNADGSRSGRMADGSDIFADVYEPGLQVTFKKPVQDLLVIPQESAFLVNLQASGNDSMALYRDNELQCITAGHQLLDTLVATEEGSHLLVGEAWDDTDTVRDTVVYLVTGTGTILPLPEGVRDGINYIDDQSVTLVLYAPGKDFVLLTGDFNNWSPGMESLMHQTPDGSRFWLTLNGLTPGREYRYQYWVDGEIRIADPYTQKTSDPWFDSFIDDQTYPGLNPYPEGKTTGITSVLETGQPPYSWSHPDFIPPQPQNLVIYELLLRDFLASHTFNSLTDTLDYLSNLGVNAIELMPVNEFEGNSSWGYNPSFYFAVDKYYGPASTFKVFVDSAHGRGIAVIMDMVLNHSFGQSPLVRLYWDAVANAPSPDNPWYNAQSPNPVFSWGYDFNHESPATQQFVDRVTGFWLTEFNVDGFRFDFSKGFTNTPGDGWAYDASRIAILKRITDRIREVKPDAYIILEHFTENREEKELSDYGMMLWGNMNTPYRMTTQGWLSGSGDDLTGISYRAHGWDQPKMVGYMESHDEERLMYECLAYGNTQNRDYRIKDLPIALKRMELGAQLFLPVPGPKMIWMFGELGYDYPINYNGRLSEKPVRWDYCQQHYRKRLYQVYAALNRLKTQYPVFQTTDFSLSLADTVKSIHLNSTDMNVTILGNTYIRQQTVQPRFQHTGRWYEFWTGDSLLVSDPQTSLVLPPGAYKMFTDKKLQHPDILSGINETDLSGFGAEDQIKIYPNPVHQRFYIRFPESAGEADINIIKLTGEVVQRIHLQRISSTTVVEVNTGELSPGIYLAEAIWQHRGDLKQAITRLVKTD